MARSSSEREYKALANTIAELLWITSLLSELGFICASPSILWRDNIGAIYMSSNPIFHAQTKHIALNFHFVREQVANVRLKLVSYIPKIKSPTYLPSLCVKED